MISCHSLHALIRRAVRPASVLILIVGTAASVTSGGDALRAEPATKKAPVPAPHQFKVGDFSCAVLFDRTAEYPATAILSNAPADEVAAALEKSGQPGTKIASPYEALLVRTAKNIVLIDTGAGPSKDPRKGRLMDSLAKVGVTPGEVDTVILTHGHLDHIGGTMGSDGKPAFPQAKYIVARAEWDFWRGPNPDLHSLDVNAKEWIDVAHKKLLALGDRVELIDRDSEIRPGIAVILVPGHTPGQMVVQVESKGERLLYVADVMLNPLALEHPDWHSKYELDPAAANAQSRRIAAMAAKERPLVHAMHFPFPGLGYVVAEGDHWKWQPVVAKD